MLKRKVVATDITNLTDARYFAARGVDFLLFDLDDMSLTAIQEIAEWVEGPEVLLLFSEKTLEFLDEAVLKIHPYGIGASDVKVFAELDFMSAHVALFQKDIKSIRLGSEVYTSIQSSSQLDSLQEDHGVMLSGGSEELVGVKSFDELDEILDCLEEYS